MHGRPPAEIGHTVVVEDVGPSKKPSRRDKHPGGEDINVCDVGSPGLVMPLTSSVNRDVSLSAPRGSNGPPPCLRAPRSASVSSLCYASLCNVGPCLPRLLLTYLSSLAVAQERTSADAQKAFEYD